MSFGFSTEAVNEEINHFLRLKEQEIERSRVRALAAMVLLEQRKRGVTVKDIDKYLPKSLDLNTSEYTEDGKLKFTDKELQEVEQRRIDKAARIESFLKKQNGKKKLSYSLNQRYPFVLKGGYGQKSKNK